MLLTTDSVSLDLLSPDSPKCPAAGDVHKPSMRLVPPHCPLAHVPPAQADHPPGVEPAQEHLKLPREAILGKGNPTAQKGQQTS